MSGPWEDFAPAQAAEGPWTDFAPQAAPTRTRAQERAASDAKRRIGTTPGQARAVSKGFSFGFSDEADAASAALETGANNALSKVGLTKGAGYGMKDAYGAVMDAEQEASNAFSKAHPVQNVGLQVVGGAVGPGMATASRYVGGARNLLSATVRSAAVGAGVGALSGAGNGRGVEGRVRGAGEGAATGAVIGAALPGGARLAQTAGRAANAAVGQPFGGAARGAAARLSEALQQDGLSPAQIATTVQQWQRSGVTPEFLNVVGENTRALIRAAGSQGGPARNAAQGYRNTTVAGIPNRAIERANALTPGETRTPAQFADETTAARDTAAQANYAGPYAERVTVPDAIKDMLSDSSGRALIGRARADAIENQDWAGQVELDRLLRDTQNGQLPQISAATLDRLTIAARERGGAFAQSGRRYRARGAMQRREQLNGVLDQVEGLRPARAEYQAQSQAIDAAEGGPSVMGPTSEFRPAQEAIAGNPQAVRAAQTRERQALRDKFGTRDQVRGILADIHDAPDVRPNLNQLYGEGGDRFADAAGNLVQKQDHANYVAPNTGSQTQSKTQDAKNAFGVVRNLLEVAGGNIRPLIERLAHGLTMTERERNILVQLGIGTPDDAMRALSAARAGGPTNALATGAARRAALATPNALASGKAER